MPKLFVAVDLPPATTAELAAIQPPATAGVRLVEPGQMHLTLHFLGEADVERTAARLGMAATPPFPLVVQGVGRFLAADGAAILWAGVQQSSELLRLHAAVAAALAADGFRPEGRSYKPHITVARCRPEALADVVEQFLARHAALLLPDVPVLGIGLYSSTFIGEIPMYRCERSFPLLVTARPSAAPSAPAPPRLPA